MISVGVRADGRCYLWPDQASATTYHLTRDREVVLPVETRCGRPVLPHWRIAADEKWLPRGLDACGRCFKDG